MITSNATPTSIDFTLRLLTKKQVATVNALSSLDMQGLTMVALNGKGASAKLAASFAGDNALDEAFEQFQASGCKNVRPLAVLIMSLTGTFTDTRTLSVCPTRRADFLTYPADVKAWALGTDNEKTQALRLRIHARVNGIVNHARGLIDAFYKAQEQETVTLAQEQETVTLAQEQETVTLAQEQETAAA